MSVIKVNAEYQFLSKRERKRARKVIRLAEFAQAAKLRHQRPTWHLIGLVCGDRNRADYGDLFRIVSRVFKNTDDDRRVLARTCRAVREKDTDDLRVRIIKIKEGEVVL